jgi:hypothetical protein
MEFHGVAGRFRIGGSGSPFDLHLPEVVSFRPTGCSLALCTSLHRLQARTHGLPKGLMLNFAMYELVNGKGTSST